MPNVNFSKVLKRAYSVVSKYRKMFSAVERTCEEDAMVTFVHGRVYA